MVSISRLLRHSLLLSLSFGLTLTAIGQSATTGSISGTITDATGAVVRGATVKLINTDRGETVRTINTNSAGFYTATSLPLGTYTVEVTNQGFKTVDVKGLVLHVNDALTVNRALPTGEVSQTVSVAANQVQLNLENATSQGLINSTQINQLVMVTRNYESLMNLQPGVVYGGATDLLQRGPVGVGGASSVVNFSVNGGRDTSNNWTIDGADNLDRGANLTLYVYPSPDAISEFKTLRGQYSAEFGRNASGQVDVVTKSGTNAIHGSAYEYFRNDALDANGYLNDFQGKPKNKYRYNDFGFTIGGPVRIPKVYNGKDKTFFFVSENWLREITYTTGTALVPTAAERSGDFSNDWYKDPTSGAWVQGPVQICTAFANSGTTNTCTAAGTKIPTISPTAAAYLKDVYSVIPTPPEQANAAKGIDPHTLTSTLPNQYPNLDTVVRIDQQVGQKLSVFYRYIHDTFPDFIGAGTFVAVPIPGLSATVSHNPGTQHLANGTYVFNPRLVANIGYAYSNGSVSNVPQGALLASAAPDIKVATPYTNTVGVVPTIIVNGMTTIGGGAVYVDHGINHQAFGDLTRTLHNHTLTVGASYNHYEKQENSATGGNQGSFAFTNDTIFTNVVQAQNTGVSEDQAFANFLTGNATGSGSSPGFSQTSRNPVVDLMENVFEVFGQDDWKITPRLTLNLGVRYSYLGQPTDASGYLSNFDPNTYSAAKAPTINNKGTICFSGTCNQTGSNAGLSTSPNASADYNGPNYLNGMIFGTPGTANNNQASPYGNKVGSSQTSNFAPRLGFAYDLFGDGKTALRGGYGWAFDELEVSYWDTTDQTNPPAVATYSQTMASLDAPAGGASSTTPSSTPGRIQAVPVNFKTPYLQQYSLDIQQQFTPTLVLDVGYFGTHGTHLAGAEEINQPVPGAWRGVVNPETANSGCYLGTPATPAFITSACDIVLNQIKPYLGYFAIDAMRTIFSSNYNGLQVKATKHLSGKTYIDGNFTWSRDLTNSPADYSGFIQNIYNVNADYGRAADDRKLVFSMDGVWELPWYRQQHGLKGRLIGGWEVSAIYTANSGLPLTVSASGGLPINYNLPGGVNGLNGSTTGGTVNDNAGLSVLGNTNSGLRPNQIADPNQGYGVRLKAGRGYEQSSTPFFYTGAFTAQDPNSNVPGTAKRGTINGPGFQRADLGLFRNFRIYDRLTFQFRAEAFNVANHTNIQTIGTAATTPSTFGLVTGYRDARILQFAGRFDF